jgi:hypothetical protein
MGGIGSSAFMGTTTVTSNGGFGAGFSPFIEGQGFGPTGGFGSGTGTFDITSLSQGTSGSNTTISSGSSVGGASNFGGGMGGGIIPTFFTAGGTGSGASTATGAGASSFDPMGASFLGTGSLTGINFQNFGSGVIGTGGTIVFPIAPP